jgi:1-acyl-sn-glycerol-3-phosphate acyltransferase
MFQNAWYQIGRGIVSVFVRGVLRADIYQPAPMPKGAKILVVNHPSTSDPAYVTVLTKEQTTILIKETLFKVPLFGRSLRMAGHVPVVAGKGQAALEAGIRLLNAGRTVVIFPEGEISPENAFHKAHSGAARLALATGAPVIPIGISLEYKKLRQIHTTVDGKREVSSWYLHGPYAMTVGEPLAFQGDVEDREQVHQVTGQIMQQIGLLCQHSRRRLSNRALQRASKTPAPRLATPKAAARAAWNSTRLAFQQPARVLTRSAAFRAIESMLLLALMYARTF